MLLSTIVITIVMLLSYYSYNYSYVTKCYYSYKVTIVMLLSYYSYNYSYVTKLL